VYSSGTLIAALRVPLDFSVVQCTLVLYSGTSGRAFALFKGRCFTDGLFPVIGVVNGAFVDPNSMTTDLNCLFRWETRFVLVTFLDSDEGIGLAQVLSSIPGISGRWPY
jgi:hypothetical protein